MTQHAAKNREKRLIAHCILGSGLGLISGIGLLGSGLGFAQTPAELVIPEPTVVQPSEPPVAESVPVEPPMSVPREALPTEFSDPVPPVISLPDPPVASEPDPYIAPNTIIFSERSSGCRSVLSAGQSPSRGLCGEGAGSVSNGRSLPALANPGQVAVSTIAPRVGSLSGNSLSVTGLGNAIAAAPSFSTPSLKDYYRRTVRPPAQLGNGNIRLIFPLAIPASISSLFGWRIHPISGDARFHTGTDLAAPLGTPVLAAFAGQVAISDFLGGYGLTVAIDHNNATQQTLYAHLSEVFVQAGEKVKQGDVIGRVGSTGNSTGPHLHFEFRQLTPDGWVALDAGSQLEYALAQLVKSLEVAQASSSPVKANVGIQGVL